MLADEEPAAVMLDAASQGKQRGGSTFTRTSRLATDARLNTRST
jgi:hypothetical protein